MKAIVVISLDLDDADQLTEVLEYANWPGIPHFGGQVRVAFDGFNDEQVATHVLNWLDK